MQAEQDYIAQFTACMAGHDIRVTGQIIADGKLHRIHVEGDHRSERNGWYVLHLDDYPTGQFGCNRRYGTDTKFTWSAKRDKKLTKRERDTLAAKFKVEQDRRLAEEKARHAAAAVKANEIWNAAADADPAHPYLVKKGIGPHGLRQADWVKEWSDPDTGEVHETKVPNALLVPIKNASKEIVSLQAIFPDKSVMGRDKDFLTDGEKRGCYGAIGGPVEHNNRVVVIICEGFATAASIHEATGYGVVIAFDAGNLKPVAEMFRARLPEAKIVIAADNDQWTTKPVNNPGLTRAREAATATSAIVALPMFKDLQSRPTDMNDLMVAEGGEAVADIIMAALDTPVPEVAATAEPEPAEGEEGVEAPADDGKKKKKSAPKPRFEGDDDDGTSNALEGNPHFRALGYDKGYHYFLIYKEGQIARIQAITSAIKNKLLSLAPDQWWERMFGGDQGVNEKAAVNALIRLSQKKGVYDPGAIRGRGAWMDEDRVVFHCGENLLVDGVETGCTEIKSRFVYECGRHLATPAKTALSDAEGKELYSIAKEFRWEYSSSAVLLTGWCALAPICGALPWRPHGWITGAKGCGKTTVQNSFVRVLTAGTALFALGESTEAGLRAKLRCDSRSLQYDETEQNSERDACRIQSAIGMLRAASSMTEAQIYKGTATGDSQAYRVVTMGLLSSIGVSLTNDADRSRFVIMSLGAGCASAAWQDLQARLVKIGADSDLPRRLLRRALDLLPTTLKNIELFRIVAGQKFGSQRDGDQYGTLLAGAWSLMSSRLATREEIERLIDNHDWSNYVEHNEMDDSERALATLLQAPIRMPRGETCTVFELVRHAAGRPVDGPNLEVKDAQRVLGHYGMTYRIDADHGAELLVSNISRGLKTLIEGTAYSADLRGHLERHKAVRRFPHPYRFNGSKERCVAVGLLDVLQEDGVVRDYVPGADVGVEGDQPF